MSITTIAAANGIAFRLATSNDETLPASAVAIRTPEMGETVLPIDAANSMGKIIKVVVTPNAVLIFGTNGPNAKNAAFPLPIKIDAANIISVITMLVPEAPRPIC